MTDITTIASYIVAVAAVLSAFFGLYHKIRKVIKDRQEAKKLSEAIIIQEAKEISQKHKVALETKIELLEAELNSKLQALSQKIINVEESVSKDLSHIKESYNNELKFLGSKIEELKDEMRTQMSQVVQLIGKLIDKA